LIKAEARQPKFTSGNEITLAVGDIIWLLTRNVKTSRTAKKFDSMHTGPYSVSKIIYKNPYKLDLPSIIRNRNILHVLLLEHSTLPVRNQLLSEQHPMIVEETEEWEVDCILYCTGHYWTQHYLVQLAGNNNIRTSWEPAEHLRKPPRAGCRVSRRASRLATGVGVQSCELRYAGHGSRSVVSLNCFS
jgi:hypothetical protein